MMKFFPVFLSLSVLILFNACTAPAPVAVDNLALQKQIQANERELAALEERIRLQKQELDYETKRSAVLENEKAALDEHLTQARNSIKDAFIALAETFEKREEELFDCYIGSPPINRNKTYSSPSKTLLVDFGNPVQADNLTICGAELYCKTPMTVQFCLIRPKQTAPNELVVVGVSAEYKFTAEGKQKVVFPREKRFSAAKGAFLGVYVSPSAALPYDDIGTGKVIDFQLPRVMAWETVLTMPAAMPERDGKAISFRFFGSTFMN